MNVRKLGAATAILVFAGLGIYFFIPQSQPTVTTLPLPSLTSVATSAQPLPESPAALASPDPLKLHQQGHFDKATTLLQQKTGPDSLKAQLTLLSIAEDSGDSRQLIAQARAFLSKNPKNMDGHWFLARGLLFASATFPSDQQYTKWMQEADSVIAKLDKAKYAPSYAPAGVNILKLEQAFLLQDWKKADKYAAKSIELGSTAGETGDMYSVRFDIALRQNRLQDAVHFLDNAMAVVEEAAANSYYGLRCFREEDLAVREFLLDKPFTHEQLEATKAIHLDMQKRGFVDPTDPHDVDFAATHQALSAWRQARDNQDLPACLALLEDQLAASSAHKPRCFFSEAVSQHIRPMYLNVMAGKICQEMGDKTKAQAFYLEAIKHHAGDKYILSLLQSL